jgi:hypothetical protein
MASSDQTKIMKEVLEALKALQINQVQLASNVDAINGRVNVLAGLKEVRDVGGSDSVKDSKKIETTPGIDEPQVHDETKIPKSPSLPTTQVEDEISPSHARKSSVSTSRIILTYVHVCVVSIRELTIV